MTNIQTVANADISRWKTSLHDFRKAYDNKTEIMDQEMTDLETENSLLRLKLEYLDDELNNEIMLLKNTLAEQKINFCDETELITVAHTQEVDLLRHDHEIQLQDLVLKMEYKSQSIQHSYKTKVDALELSYEKNIESLESENRLLIQLHDYAKAQMEEEIQTLHLGLQQTKQQLQQEQLCNELLQLDLLCNNSKLHIHITHHQIVN